MTYQAAKTALLTGASRGIGAAIREELSERGYRVLAPPRAELDLSSQESLRAYLAGNASLEIDVLINNAAVNTPQKIEEATAHAWDLACQTNLRAAFDLIKHFAPRMAERGFGRILNISSILAVVTKPGRAVYSMTKAGLDALTRAAALEFGSRGVLVNSLAPGYVDTDLTRANNAPDDIARILGMIPVGRMAQPAELAKIAAFLVSEDNTYVTGQTIVADGGFTCL
jgi:3-oxoacyl-[acyl-carrier protein] reductase